MQKMCIGKIYKLKTVVQIKLKTNKICNLTDLGKDLRSFLLSSNKIFAASTIQFFNDSINNSYNFLQI